MSTTRRPDHPAGDPEPRGRRPDDATADERPEAPAIPEPRPPEVAPLRLDPLLPRRQHPQLLVEVDGSPASFGSLVWALREAARREAVVVALAVLDAPEDDPLGSSSRITARAHAAAHDRAQALLLRAIAETGVRGRSRTAVVDRPVFEALTAAGRGADLVLVHGAGKALLRHAVPRPPSRRLARGA